jgi:hypothetical protein
MRFIVSRKVADEHKLKSAERDTENFYRADDVEPIPLSARELEQVRSSVGDIPDEELREAVLKATVKDLEWKKGLAAMNGPQERPQSF